MYRHEWIEQLKLRAAPSFGTSRAAQISPVVWSLGLTSFLTDISAEMVNSILPIYLVLYMRLSPLQYGAIDGVYNGLSVALVSVAAGVFADRWSRQKAVAGLGYGLSAVCKLLLLASASAWGWITVVMALDRMGKGIRTAPRDALISLHTSPAMFGTAFGVHRAMDSAGALIGPIVAFALLAQLPGDFDVLWFVSFVVAALGVAALWLFVPRSPRPSVGGDGAAALAPSTPRPAWISRRLIGLTVCGTLLGLVTISDGFFYLLLQERSGTSANFVPLFFVATAAAYMVFSVPIGIMADRFGRRRVFVAGYAVLVLLYVLLWLSSNVSLPLQIGCLLLLGLYYAATEGVLMALASTVVSAERRTTGLAILGTCIGVGKLLSSIGFGWMWQTYGVGQAVLVFAAAMIAVLMASAVWLRMWQRDR